MRCRQITTRREGLHDPRPPVRPGPRPRKPVHKTELVSPLIAMMTKIKGETHLARLVPRVLVTGAPVEQRQDVRERGCKLRVVVHLRVPL